MNTRQDNKRDFEIGNIEKKKLTRETKWTNECRLYIMRPLFPLCLSVKLDINRTKASGPLYGDIYTFLLALFIKIPILWSRFALDLIKY